ncbi:Esterase, putative isoform 1 [Hibiscus syriacus]|uniref:Esterase, putative isoform 1 n=1 Tax=Hibiscus syriacus TaxID=106335 RepID=A0A6A2ZBR0_HIBSY|nr:Esterase, putative isoform 1 [Hibiscus syriacus]
MNLLDFQLISLVNLTLICHLDLRDNNEERWLIELILKLVEGFDLVIEYLSHFSFYAESYEACVSLKDEQVAARVTADAEKDEWFVVKVTNFDEKNKNLKYWMRSQVTMKKVASKEVQLPASCIIPFPKRNDPPSTQEFPAGRHVLAVLSGTTALYKATVVSTPRKRKSDEYLLEFDDDEEDGALPQRMVPFHKVVPFPEGHRQ